MTDATSFTWAGTSGATYKWGTKYAYDANGNIMAMKRAGNSGTAYDMDDLTYNYYSNTNQLRFVKDDISSGTYSVDFDDQYIVDSDPGTGGTQHDIYQYDKIGNLVKDVAEDISEIAWTVYGKIKFVKKNTANKLIEFDYDPMGNRVMKKVGPVTGSGTVTWTYYVRDAQGNIMSTYTRIDDGDETLSLTELHVYGSSRLGLIQTNIDVLASFTEDTYFYRKLGEKRYELVNHLGNVLSVISDRRLAFQDGTSGNVSYYEADVIAAQDYDPFGMQLIGRQWALANDDYRFGFNGYENTDELLGDDVAIDFGARVYDSRIGRYFSIDPRQIEYAWQSSYMFYMDSPIWTIDIDGKGGTDCGCENPPCPITTAKIDKLQTSIELPNIKMPYLLLPEVIITAKRDKNILERLWDEGKHIINDALAKATVFTAGASNSIASNNVAGRGRVNPEEAGDYDVWFAAGQLFGDIVSEIQGTVEVLGGGSIAVAGSETVILIDVGGEIAVHGALVDVYAAKGIHKDFVYFAEHRKNKQNSNYEKHTGKRSGKQYDRNQDSKRGEKNRKFRPKPNPNKK